MTPQEQQMIQSLADRINKTELSEKDPDAEQLLQQALGRNPDALYVLAQTVLVQGYALEQAQKQLADTRAQMEAQRQQVQQAPQPKHASSFLGGLLGLADEPARPAPPPPPVQYSQPPYTPVQQYAPAGYGAPGFGPPPQPYAQPQSGGFLRSAMQTATGVAAGALAFQGIESLMHGFGGGGGFGGGSGFSGGGGGRTEEIVNNYYGDSAPPEHGHSLSPDIEDRRTSGSSFEDAVTENDHHDGQQGFVSDTGDDDPGSADTDTPQDDSTFDDGAGTFDTGSDGGTDDSF